MRKSAVLLTVLPMAAALLAACEHVTPTAVTPTRSTPVPAVRAALVTGEQAMSRFQVCSVGAAATYHVQADPVTIDPLSTPSPDANDFYFNVAAGDCVVVYTGPTGTNSGGETVNNVTVTLSSILTPGMQLSTLVGHLLHFECTPAAGGGWDCTTTDTPNATPAGTTGVTYNVNGDFGAVGNFTFVPTPSTACGTFTIGYYKTHAGFGPQADVVTPLLPIWLGTQGGTSSVQVTTAAQAVTLLSMSGDASNPVNKLYAQLLAAKLNVASGNAATAIQATMDAADLYLATHTASPAPTGAVKAMVLGWMTTLDNYNNGIIGPGHCD